MSLAVSSGWKLQIRKVHAPCDENRG